MPCDGRYAEAWDLSTFWCLSALVFGADDSGGTDNAFVTDNVHNFQDQADQWFAEIGQVIKNLTTGTYGYITGVAAHILTTTNTWSDTDRYGLSKLSPDGVITSEAFLDLTAPDIWMALAASGACECALSAYGAEYLKKLNVIEAAVYHNCPCASPRFGSDAAEALAMRATEMLDNLRTGKVEVCDGETGSEFPAQAFAQQALTPWRTAEIMYDDLLRDS